MKGYCSVSMPSFVYMRIVHKKHVEYSGFIILTECGMRGIFYHKHSRMLGYFKTG